MSDIREGEWVADESQKGEGLQMSHKRGRGCR